MTAATTLLVLAAWLGRASLLDFLELRTYDLRFLSRGPIEPYSPITVVAVDEKSLDSFGRWPWPRSKIGDLVRKLDRDGAKVIAFDIGFPEASADAAQDNALAVAITESEAAVVLGYFFHMSHADLNYDIAPAEIDRQHSLIGPSKYPMVAVRGDAQMSLIPAAYAPESDIEPLAKAAGSAGYFSLRQDEDGVVRWMPLVIRSGEEYYPPLSVVAAWQYLDRPRLVLRVGPHGVEGIQLGDRQVPTDPTGRILIDYRGPPRTFPHVSAGDVLAGDFAPGTFRDRIVLLGATATGLYDVRSTPFSTVFPGIEIHAAMIDNLLSGSFLRRPGWLRVLDLLAIVVLAAIAALAVANLGTAAAALVVAGLFGFYLLTAYELFVRAGLWVGIVYPLASLLAAYLAQNGYDYLRERREKRKISDAFGRYVSPVVINEMLKDPSRLQLGGEQKVLTVLFSDLAGFTSYSERYTPQQMIELLSEYYARMTERIFEYDGMLKEYVGDELMAIFGAPVEHADHAARACRAALAMRQHRHALTEEWAAIGRPPIYARTGVNSGPMLVGNLGSEYRFSYGCLGDNVNLGSRLEGLNKQYGTEILIGEQTAELIGDEFTLREVDVVRVVGKKKPTRLYELVGFAVDPLPAPQAAAVRTYASALEAYRAQRWDTSTDLLRECLQAWPKDGPSKVLLERCRLFATDPPGEDWDGVFEATRK